MEANRYESCPFLPSITSSKLVQLVDGLRERCSRLREKRDIFLLEFILGGKSQLREILKLVSLILMSVRAFNPLLERDSERPCLG